MILQGHMAVKGWNRKRNSDFKTESSAFSDALVLLTLGCKRARIGRAGPRDHFKDLL